MSGFLGALIESTEFPYRQMNADILLSSSDMNTLADSNPVPRQRMYEAVAARRHGGSPKPTLRTCSEGGHESAKQCNDRGGRSDCTAQRQSLVGDGEARKQGAYDIDLPIARGQLTGLVGASGSGKTTLPTLMGCLRRVQDGSITLLGIELNGATEDLLVASRRRLGFIFQAHNLHDTERVNDFDTAGFGI